MELSSTELACVKFITTIYSKVWPFPFTWNFQTSTLSVNEKRSLVTFRILVSLATIILATGLVNAFIYPILLPSHPFSRIDKFMLLLTSVCATGICYLIYETCITHRYDFAAFFNGICTIEHELNIGKEARHISVGRSLNIIRMPIRIIKMLYTSKIILVILRALKKGITRVSPALSVVIIPIAVIPITAIGALFVPTVFVASGFDPLRYLMDYILPHPTYRTMSTIVASFLFRLVIFTITMFQNFRSTTYFRFWFIVIITRAVSICNITSRMCLSTNVKAVSIVTQKVFVVFNTAKILFVSWINGGLTILFIAIVMITLIVVKGSPDRLGVFVYGWFTTLLVLLLPGAIFMLGLMCQVFDRVQGLQLTARLQVRFLYARQPNWEMKILRLVTASRAPIKVNYTLIGPLGQSFLVEYLETLLLRITDAILVIDFN